MNISIQTILLIVIGFLAYTQWLHKRYRTRLEKLENFLKPIMVHSKKADDLKKSLEDKMNAAEKKV